MKIARAVIDKGGASAIRQGKGYRLVLTIFDETYFIQLARMLKR